MKPYAFLFDGSTKGLPSSPLPMFTAAVLAALSRADPQGRTYAEMRVGLPMLHQFADRTTAVHGTARGSGRTISHDVDVYKYVVWEWLDSLKLDWNSIDREQGEEIFRLHTGECVALSALHEDVRNAVDSALRDVPGYIGSFAIDPGNPVHRGAFFDSLIRAAAIVDGAVIQERSIEGDEVWELAGAAQFQPGGLIWKDYGWLVLKGPKGIPRVDLSGRGAQAANNLARKQAPNAEERVIEAIQHEFLINTGGKTFDFQSVGKSSDLLQALMPEGKFTKYLFDRKHNQGSSKAIFLIDQLGIQPEDWRYLAAQFYFGLLMAQPDSVKLNEWEGGYGVRFEVPMRVRSRSGKTAVVVAGWNMNPGQIPSLSTAYPGDRNADAVEPGDPPILLPGSRTNADWARLWDWANAAGVQAGETCVPTPMYVAGFDPVSEGAYGYAKVRVPDARTGLARWLVRYGPGGTDGYGGAVILNPPNIRSFDRATAWARTVALVLWLNGIDAKVETYLD